MKNVEGMLHTTIVRALLLGLLILGCSLAPHGGEPPAHVYETWQVLDGQTGHPIAFDEWIKLLATQDIIYLGEEHRNQWHIEGALKILRAMIQHGQHPVLAMEMFGWDGQAALNQYVKDTAMDRDEFLSLSQWEQNWGGSFQEYEPLVSFARNQHVALLALNPPRPLVRKVAAQGLKKAMNDPDMVTWRMKDERIVEDAAYREVILRQLQLCHGGLPEEAYGAMYEASMFRDEGMAKTIRESLRSSERDKEAPTSGPIVSYTGGGHIQYRLPIPKRVLRKGPRELRQTTIYMTSFTPQQPEDIQTLLRDGIADYVWLTPIGANGPPKRCR